MRGISDTEVLGYYCDGEYTCALHSPEPSKAELDDSFVTPVFAGAEHETEPHCAQCHPGPTYLDPARVTGVKHTQLPIRGQTRSGYGKRIPSTRMLKLDGKRWHRVYVMQWSNMGTPYVVIRGERHLLG